MKLVLFDLDGLLADDRHRWHLHQAKRFAEYYSPKMVMRDTVIAQGRALYEQHMADPDTEVGYCTARSEINRPVTRQWLEANGFDTSLVLYMRPNTGPLAADKCSASQLKVAVIEWLVPHYSEIHLYDDSKRNVDAVAKVACAHHCRWVSYPRSRRTFRQALRRGYSRLGALIGK